MDAVTVGGLCAIGAIMSEVGGKLTLRQRETKQPISVIIVRRLAGNIVELDVQVEQPEVSIELEPDIALAMADLLMDAAALDSCFAARAHPR